ncbi:MAG: hypothetical protein KDA90_22630, partial [Planctomycetaceae bacterium]|nr:hypothetical protein [Planctomycetaceae bacterium]
PYGQLVSQHQDSESTFYHFDALGSTESLTDATQTKTDEYVYDAFGKLVAQTGSTANKFTFVGELGYYFDEETGQISIRWRQYGPDQNRFTSEDPIGFASGTTGLYEYVGNNPVNAVDPSGLEEISRSFVGPTLAAAKGADSPFDLSNPAIGVVIGDDYAYPLPDPNSPAIPERDQARVQGMFTVKGAVTLTNEEAIALYNETIAELAALPSSFSPVVTQGARDAVETRRNQLETKKNALEWAFVNGRSIRQIKPEEPSQYGELNPASPDAIAEMDWQACMQKKWGNYDDLNEHGQFHWRQEVLKHYGHDDLAYWDRVSYVGGHASNLLSGIYISCPSLRSPAPRPHASPPRGTGPRPSRFPGLPQLRSIRRRIKNFPNLNVPKSSIPQKATDTLNTIRQTNAAPKGYKGGATFANDGRGGGQVLPKSDSAGKPITYREFDVNPYQKGVNRGAERIVIGSDGRSYFTNNHYRTFTELP